jgi:hypothetical protein
MYVRVKTKIKFPSISIKDKKASFFFGFIRNAVTIQVDATRYSVIIRFYWSQLKTLL